jgi:hypothetical protein
MGYKITLNRKAPSYHGFIIDGQRWITDGKLMAIDPLWAYTDKRIVEMFAQGKPWKWDGNGGRWAGETPAPGGIAPILELAGAADIQIRPSDITFRGFRVFLGAGTRVLVNEQHMSPAIETYHYGKRGNMVTGKIGGSVVSVFMGGDHLDQQFQKEIEAVAVNPDASRAVAS